VHAVDQSAATVAGGPGDRPPRRRLLTDALALAVAGAALYGLFGHRIGTFDLHSFLAAAVAVRHGRNPYASVDSAVFKAGHAFVYPYFVAWLYVPLTYLPNAAAVAVDIVVSGAALVVGCRLLGRRRVGAALLVLVSSTTVISLQMGTVNPLLFLGLAVAWSQRRRPVLAGGVLALVAASKLFLVPMLAWPVLCRRWRVAAAAIATLAVVLGLGWALGPIGPITYARLLTHLSGNETVHSWSLSSFVESFGAPGQVADGVVAVAVLGMLGAGYARARGAGAERALFAGAVVACLLASPIVWSSYLPLAAVPLLVARDDDTALAVMALASWVLVTPDQTSAWRVAAGVVLAGAAAVWVVAAERPDWRRVGRRWWPLLPAAAGLAVALAVLTPSEASALPTLAGLAAVAAVGLRDPTGTGPRPTAATSGLLSPKKPPAYTER